MFSPPPVFPSGGGEICLIGSPKEYRDDTVSYTHLGPPFSCSTLSLRLLADPSFLDLHLIGVTRKASEAVARNADATLGMKQNQFPCQMAGMMADIAAALHRGYWPAENFHSLDMGTLRRADQRLGSLLCIPCLLYTSRCV